jgi:hypothetical protein
VNQPWQANYCEQGLRYLDGTAKLVGQPLDIIEVARVTYQAESLITGGSSPPGYDDKSGDELVPELQME